METRIYISAELHADGTDGPWLFKIKRSNAVGAVGTADDYDTIKSMAIEALGDVRDSDFKE